MEKRISYSQFQQIKSAAKMIDPNMRKIEALKKKILPLINEMKQYQALNDSLEEGIVKVIGFHVADLVKKVIEPTGATDKMGKPIKVTKYLPTDIVSYDEQKKEYVINIPEAPATETPASSGEDSVFNPVGAKTAVPEVATEPANEQETKRTEMPWDNN